VVSFPGLVHIGEDKDFTPVIEKALELGGYAEDKAFTGINGGHTVTTGFGHGAVLANAGKVVEAVKAGDSATSSSWAAATAPSPAATTTPSSSSRRRRTL
jgi:type IV secretory pathway TrbL component